MTNPGLDQIARAIATAPCPQDMTTRIVAIDGLGGAGKSTLAARLAPKLDARVIHTDDFASWDVPLDWHDRMMAQVLDPLSQNRPARYQRYDWGSRRLAEWHEVATGGTVIIEGVSALRVLFRPALAYGIFINTPQTERLRRGLIRDGDHMRDQWIAWQAAEDAYITRDAPQVAADMVLDGAAIIA